VVKVVSVQAKSPVKASDLRTGDMIYAADGVSITTMDDLYSYLSDKNPGSKITLSIIRGGTEKDLIVETGER
jgi:S1-C subfamily serine protease